MINKKIFSHLTPLSLESKKSLKGGSYWTAALAVTIVSSTVMNFIQLIYNLVNAVNNKDSNDNSTQYSNKNSSYLNTNSLKGNSNGHVRLSNYPSKTAFSYNL